MQFIGWLILGLAFGFFLLRPFLKRVWPWYRRVCDGDDYGDD